MAEASLSENENYVLSKQKLPKNFEIYPAPSYKIHKNISG